MKEESLIKFYRGNRFVGNTYPLAVVIGDTSYKGIPFGEHYIFHSFPGIPFLYQRVRGSGSSDIDSIDFSEFPEVFSAQALLEYQLTVARNQFEFSISQKDRELHLQLFWTSTTFEFCEVDKHPFAQFRVFGNFTSEMETMFTFTRCRLLKSIEREITRYPTVSWVSEPKA